MVPVPAFCSEFERIFPTLKQLSPWEVTNSLEGILSELISRCGNDYYVQDGIAIHVNAVIEEGAVLKAPLFISENCFVAANAYLRGGVYLGESVTVGPGCEIKTSLIFRKTSLAHFNFVGDSIIGSHVNFEAGAVIANHFNERKDKEIRMLFNSEIIHTQAEKFGALIGDQCKIGANAVLSPGTLLPPGALVKRLELVEQC